MQKETVLSRQRGPRRGTRQPTVADVAALASVSPMTVSRVVNGEANVLAGTREKVEKAIKLLNYRPNSNARRLAGGRQCRIALLHSNPSASYLSALLVAVLEETGRRDSQLVVEQSAPREDAAAFAQRVWLHRIDGIILPPPLSDEMDLRKAFADLGVPLALIGTGHGCDNAHMVTIDDESAAYDMTARLVRMGHRRIGFICGAANQSSSGLRRIGYGRALRDFGIDIADELIVPGDFTYTSGLEATRRLLELQSRPTAIFASNDDMAAAAVSVAHRMGLDVPGQLSVCGFDDTTQAITVWPELTTIRQPVGEMARVATMLLVESISAAGRGIGFEPASVRLPYDLVERASDGPARAMG